MSDIKAVKTLCIAENILCIFRNYTLYSKKARKIVLVRFIIEMCCFLSICIQNQIVLYKYFGSNLSNFSLIVVFNSLFATHSFFCIFNGIYRCNSFIEFLNNIGKLCRSFENDVTIKEYINNLSFIAVFGSVIFFIIPTLDIIGDRIFFSGIYKLTFGDVLLTVARILIDVRYLFEYLIYFVLVLILQKLFESFNSLLEDTQKRLNDTVIIDGTNIDQITLQTIDEWVLIYGYLEKTSKEFKKCFAMQIFGAIVISVPRYVVLAFRIISPLVKEALSSHSIWISISLTFAIIYHVGAVLLVVFVGQKVSNHAAVLRVYLARLYNTLAVYPHRPELKRVKDLQRMVLKNPVEINWVRSMPVAMPIIPVVLSFTINYVFIMLQFDQVTS